MSAPRWFKTMLFVLCMFSNPAFAGPAQDRANNVFGSISGNLTNSESLSQNFQSPILNQQGAMTDLSNSKTFNTDVLCSASNNYLTVTGQVLSNGESELTYEFDSNVDGYVDTTNTISNISGYCSNGFIQCDPGTWSNCQYQLWQMNASGLYHVPVPVDDAHLMKACFCANSSCLPTPQNHLSDNVERLGTGIANTAQIYESYYLISNVEKTTDSVRFFGQNLGSCYSGANTNLTGYKSNPNDLTSDGANASINHDQFSLINNSAPINSISTVSVVPCNINRILTANSRRQGTGTVSFSMFAQGRDYVECEFSFLTGNVSCSTDGDRYEYQLSNTIEKEPFCTLGGQINLTGVSQWDGTSRWGNHDNTVTFNYIQDPDCSNDFTAIVRIDDTTLGSDPRFYLGQTFTYTYDITTCALDEVVSDDCATLDSDPDCTIQNETVDSIETILNGATTTNQTSDSTQTVSSQYCSYEVTRPFFQIEREYLCDRGTPAYTADTSRFTEPTLTQNGADFSIDTSAGTQAFSILDPSPPQPSCTLSCRVQRSVLDTSVNESGVASSERTDQSRTEKILKRCNDNVCPLEAGETVLEQCACIDSFEDALLSLQMLRLANQDLECEHEEQSVEACLGDVQVFRGRESRCRTAGFQTRWDNCCNLGGKVFEDQYGSKTEGYVESLSQMSETFDNLTGTDTTKMWDAIDFLTTNTPEVFAENAIADTANWLFSPCADDSGPAALISSDMCIEIGEECIERWSVFGCVQRRKKYCCFKSQLAKILHEQARPQFPGFDYGTMSVPNCDGFTLEQFQAIDFGSVDFTDLENSIKTQAQSTIQGDINTKMQDFQNTL